MQQQLIAHCCCNVRISTKMWRAQSPLSLVLGSLTALMHARSIGCLRLCVLESSLRSELFRSSNMPRLRALSAEAHGRQLVSGRCESRHEWRHRPHFCVLEMSCPFLVTPTVLNLVLSLATKIILFSFDNLVKSIDISCVNSLGVIVWCL